MAIDSYELGQRAVALRGAGHSYEAIGEELGLTATSAYRECNPNKTGEQIAAWKNKNDPGHSDLPMSPEEEAMHRAALAQLDKEIAARVRRRGAAPFFLRGRSTYARIPS